MSEMIQNNQNTNMQSGDSWIQELSQQAQTQTVVKNENIVAGVIGAVIGSLIGVVCIIVLGQLGYIASISGAVLAICTLKGYELLAKSISTKGVIISVIIMIVMVYVGDRLDWAMLIAKEYDGNVLDAFMLVPDMLKEGFLDKAMYVKNILMLYAFTALGSYKTVANALAS